MSPAATPTAATHASRERSYSLSGLPDREVLVFKSMVRLLGHRTHCQWVYLAHSTELHVVAEGLPASLEQAPLAQQTLVLGAGNFQRQSYLRLPLHANELEAELNRLGALINPANTVAAPAPLETAEDGPMRMLRWPPATLLTSVSYIRLATLMASKPLTLRELHHRSGESMAMCMAFFNGLKQHELLVPATAASLPAAAHMQQATPKVLLQTTKSPVQAGLLARIRMRLGLGSTGASAQTSRA